MVDERTAYWGARDAARYRTQDDDPTGGDYVVAETLDANGDPVDVLLRWDDTAGEWVSGGPVNMNGSDVTNVGALDANSVSTEVVSDADFYAEEGDDLQTILDNAEGSGGGVVIMTGDMSGPAPTIPHNVDLIGVGGQRSDFGNYYRRYVVTSGTVRFRDDAGNETRAEREATGGGTKVSNVTLEGIVFDAEDAVAAPAAELWGFQNCEFDVRFKRYTGTTADHGVEIGGINVQEGGVFYNHGRISFEHSPTRGIRVFADGRGVNANGLSERLNLIAVHCGGRGFDFESPDGDPIAGNNFAIRCETNHDGGNDGPDIVAETSDFTDNDIRIYCEGPGPDGIDVPALSSNGSGNTWDGRAVFYGDFPNVPVIKSQAGIGEEFRFSRREETATITDTGSFSTAETADVKPKVHVTAIGSEVDAYVSSLTVSNGIYAGGSIDLKNPDGTNFAGTADVVITSAFGEQ